MVKLTNKKATFSILFTFLTTSGGLEFAEIFSTYTENNRSNQ